MRDDSQAGPRLEALLALGAPGGALEEAQALAGVEQALFGRAHDPVRFSRYVLLDRLGEGAAGVVFRAYDPQLDRQVAIKLIHAGQIGESRGRARLLREAQALARLSHPNVVSVFDVGSYDEEAWGRGLSGHSTLEVPARGVFLVMELVKGLDLGRWKQEQSRDADEVLAVYLMAGRGLAAAHTAGLVHRDFKPSNVLLGEDGRVRVVDFGLVRHVDEVADLDRNTMLQSASPAERAARTPLADNATATRTGAILGTPAYMAPEQHRGESADAQSDQFAFAVSLVEALTGQRPFADAGANLALAKAEPGGAHLAGAETLDADVEAALRRAMSPRPAERFASMDALLDALMRAGRRRRWLLGAAIGGVLVASLAGAALLARGPSAAQRCEKETLRGAAVWDVGRSGRVRNAFEGTGLADAGVAFASVDGRMTTWVQGWRGAAQQTCVEALSSSHQSASNARRSACLERRLREASTLTSLWTTADVDLVRSAPLSVVELGQPQACTSARAGASQVDARTRAAINDALARLAEARALTLSGRYGDAMDLVEAADAVAQAHAQPGLRAAVALARAGVLERRGDLAGAERQLFAAIWAGNAAHEDELVADAWLRLVWIVGVEEQRVDEGRRWIAFAEAALARIGKDPLRLATLDHNRAGLDLVSGDPGAALSGYRRALAVQREHLGEDHPIVARSLNHIGNVLLEQREFSEALGYARRSQAIRSRTLGPGHPLVAASLNNVAIAQLRLGRLSDALAAADEALKITRGTATPEERVAWHIRADVLRDMGRSEAAEAAMQHAQALDLQHARPRR